MYTTASGFGFIWVPKYANVYVSASISLPCAFSCLVVLLCSDFFLLFYGVLLLILRCLFSNERQKWCGSGWKGSGKELEGIEEDIIRIYHIFKNLFSI